MTPPDKLREGEAELARAIEARQWCREGGSSLADDYWTPEIERLMRKKQEEREETLSK